MNDSEFSSKKAKILEPSRVLQSKVGTGKVEQQVVNRLQKRMEETKTDFEPMALEFLRELESAIENAERKLDNPKVEHYQKIANPVMQIKANASMFGYALIGELATMVLNLIENAPEFDKNTIELAYALKQALNLILVKRLKGDGGQIGASLKEEMENAAQRFKRKYI